MTQHFLDPELAFSTMNARSVGLSRRDIDADMLDRPFHALRSSKDESTSEPMGRAEQERHRIERAALQFSVYMAGHEFFSHTTAAVLWGLPLPLLGNTTVHVAVLKPRRAPRGVAVKGHQLATPGVDVVTHPDLGVRLTSPAATWALLGSELRRLYDVIAVADAIVRTDRVAGPHGHVVRPALGSIADLAAAVPRGRRGVTALREALPRVRTGVASRPETWLRLTLVDAALPEPDTDVDVYDDAGTFIGSVELAYRRWRIAFEYEGDHHRVDRSQWNRDIQKHDALVRAGWRVIRITSEMLFGAPGHVVALARAALRSRR